MMSKILQKPFQEHNLRFEKDQEVDKKYKKIQKVEENEIEEKKTK